MSADKKGGDNTLLYKNNIRSAPLTNPLHSLRYILDSELGVISLENKDGQDGNKPASEQCAKR